MKPEKVTFVCVCVCVCVPFPKVHLRRLCYRGYQRARAPELN